MNDLGVTSPGLCVFSNKLIKKLRGERGDQVIIYESIDSRAMNVLRYSRLCPLMMFRISR
jgi:hypothetical protein